MFCIAFTWCSVVKYPPANAGDVRDAGSIPGSTRSSGRGLDNPLQYSCLGNSRDRGARKATIHRAAKSRTWLRDWTYTSYQILVKAQKKKMDSISCRLKCKSRLRSQYLLGFPETVLTLVSSISFSIVAQQWLIWRRVHGEKSDRTDQPKKALRFLFYF